MPEYQTRVVTEQRLSAIVLRCQCGPRGTAIHVGALCPKPLTLDAGTLGYWHRHWWKRAAYKISKFIRDYRS